MKFLSTALSIALACTLSAAESPWLADFPAAQKQATEQKKSILILVTGTDWSAPCIEMEKEVFSQESFLSAAAEKLVLTKVDLPQDESLMTDELIHQANVLQETYKVDSYPTVILTDPSGRPFAKTGYLDGDAMKYVSHLNTLLAKKGAFDGMIEEASKLEGFAKAQKLTQALQSLDLSDYYLITFYPETITEIDHHDPDHQLPFLTSLKAAKRFLDLEVKIEFLLEEGENQEVLKLVEEGINDEAFSVGQRQQMQFFKTVVHMDAEKYDQALAALEECRKLAPDTDLAKSLDVLRSHLVNLKNERDTAPIPDEEVEIPVAEEVVE